VHENLLVDAVVVVQVVWSELVEPARLPGVYITRKDSARPLVVARSLIRIPWTRIPGAVKDEILFGVVRDPTPHGAAADFPRVARPTAHTKILALILWIVRVKVWTNQDVSIWSGVIRAPGDLPVGSVERREPATHTKLTATVANEHFSLNDERRHRDRLAQVDLADFCL